MNTAEITTCGLIIGAAIFIAIAISIEIFLKRRKIRKEFKNYPDELHDNITDHIQNFQPPIFKPHKHKLEWCASKHEYRCAECEEEKIS